VQSNRGNPVIGDLVADRYEIEDLCGSGGMSSVFRARDRLLDRRVALKILHGDHADDEDSIARFRREARSAAQLSHPHVVTVIDRGNDGDRQFIVFEYIDGEDLKQLVGRAGRLPVRRALELTIAVADGLAFAHASGLVHRDVKPQNILVDRDGEVKVTDFGIARSLHVDHGVTQTGAVLGTSAYLSPEQAAGKAVTPATDVYSLGIVLWELLTGDVPFPGDNFVAVALRHINEEPPDLCDVRPDVPSRLAAAVARALAKAPERRFPSMDAFADELRQCLAELDHADSELTLVGMPSPEPAPPPLPASKPRPRRRRRRRRVLLVALAALAAATAIVAGILGLRGSSHGIPSPPAAQAGSGAPVALHGVGDYDPQGSGSEHASTAPLATDGDPSTSWYTETYATPSFGGLKDGLGLVLDAGSSTTLSALEVTTGTPGFTARVETGDSRSGPFAPDSAVETVSGPTTFSLQGESGRYYVVWITQLPPSGKAAISEVTATR